MRTQAVGNAVVVTVGSSVRLGDVDQLEGNLRLVAPLGHLTVDLAGARGLDDLVVARLAAAVRRVAPSAEFRGLSRHHQRLLRYLGHVEPDDAPVAQAG